MRFQGYWLYTTTLKCFAKFLCTGCSSHFILKDICLRDTSPHFIMVNRASFSQVLKAERLSRYPKSIGNACEVQQTSLKEKQLFSTLHIQCGNSKSRIFPRCCFYAEARETILSRLTTPTTLRIHNGRSCSYFGAFNKGELAALASFEVDPGCEWNDRFCYLQSACRSPFVLFVIEMRNLKPLT